MASLWSMCIRVLMEVKSDRLESTDAHVQRMPNKALHGPPDVSVTGLAVGRSLLRWQGPRQILAPVS